MLFFSFSLEEVLEGLSDSNLFDLVHIGSAPISAESSAHPSPGGGWHVAPPVCFRDGSTEGSQSESSGFENLLIEHPSRSVYLRPTASDIQSDIDASRVRRPTADGRPLRVLDLLQKESNCPPVSLA